MQSRYRKAIESVRITESFEKGLVEKLRSETILRKQKRRSCNALPFALAGGAAALGLLCVLAFGRMPEIPARPLPGTESEETSSCGEAPSTPPPVSLPSQRSEPPEPPSAQEIQRQVSLQEAREATGWPLVQPQAGNIEQIVLLLWPDETPKGAAYIFSEGQVRVTEGTADELELSSFQRVEYHGKSIYVHEENGRIYLLYIERNRVYKADFTGLGEAEGCRMLLSLVF